MNTGLGAHGFPPGPDLGVIGLSLGLEVGELLLARLVQPVHNVVLPRLDVALLDLFVVVKAHLHNSNGRGTAFIQHFNLDGSPYIHM
eukprot:scaffold401711_cov19-Prasinocladus_malaysianus.AAC.1